MEKNDNKTTPKPKRSLPPPFQAGIYHATDEAPLEWSNRTKNGNGMGAMSAPTAATAISDGGLGGLLWPLILVVLAVIGSVVVLVLVLGRRSDARSRSGNRFPPTTQTGSQPQAASGRCPSCGAPIEGMQFCGNCGMRLP